MTTSPVGQAVQHLRRAVLLHEADGLTDSVLLGWFIERRDEAAFEVLVRRHGPMVLSVCRRLLGHGPDAEDAFQATFLVLVRKAAAVVPRERVGHWLYGVAYQTARKARALAARRRARERQVTAMPEPEAAPPADWRDVAPLLDQELNRLPDKYRIPVVLCDLEGRTRKEAARQLGWPEGTVSGRLARARTLLARRLTRRGVALAGGSLALLLGGNAASAGVPAALVASTVQAASQWAAGSAVATGAISVPVAALTEAVMKAMLLARLKTAAVLLAVLALAGLGAGTLIHRALAEKPSAAEPTGGLARKAAEGPATLSAPVVAVSADGKSITLETAPANGRTGEEAKRTDVRVTDKTEVSYDRVGLNGAKPTEGYHADVTLQPGSADTAARVHFTAADAARDSRAYVALVKAVSADGKTITLELPPGRGEQEPRKTDIKLTDQSKLTYSYVAKDGAKPTAGYQAEVWVEGRGSDTAVKVHFVDPAREKESMLGGKVIGLAKDGNGFTLEVPPQVRGGDSRKADVKITPTTEITFHGVGPDGAKLTEGYGARVWLLEGSPDTAVRVMVYKSTGRRR
jgi:RNA polymerase sigma factor (sigma-70 family)